MGMENDGFDVGIFALEKELPFTGHPILGTAFGMFQYILKERKENLIQS